MTKKTTAKKIRVSDIEIEWDSEHGTCTFETLPVAMMWVDTTLAGLMSGVQAMVGTERFGLALQSEGRKSVEADWEVISQFPDFRDGFAAIANIAAVAGWGEWRLLSLNEKKKEAVFRVWNSWEGRYQKVLSECWGSGMLAGKMAGYCSRLFETNCWADQTAYIAKGDAFDEFVVRPSKRSIEREIEGLLETDEATRADMAVALEKLRREAEDRKRADEALKESEEKYRELVENANDAICVVQDGLIKFHNQKTRELIGYSAEEFARIPFLDYIHPEDREMVLERHMRRLKGDPAQSTYSFRIQDHAGEELWAQVNAVRTKWEGKPAVLSFIRNINEQKRLEAQLQQAQKMEAIGTLAGGVAHDFNNLLQAIQGYAELLLFDKGTSSPDYTSLQEICNAAERGGELTQQLLTFSRKVKSRMRPTDLSREVEKVSRLLDRTLPKMIEIELHLMKGLGIVNADPSQIEQVLMNLAVNARDAMPDGGRLIIETAEERLDEAYCRRHLGARPGDYVMLTVSDTGQGMEKETLEHVFEPFYTTKRVGEGTGLGLAMVYGIVKSHEGFIMCYSEPGEGTTFKIYLPVIEEAEQEESLEDGTPLRGGTETILLVDDEDPLRNLGEQVLTRFGYSVLTASDGETALEVYRSKKQEIDLVILDLIMPGMGGKRCLEKLVEESPEIAVVIASGYSVNGPTKDAIEAGARGFVSKPYVTAEMLRVVREVLDHDGSARS